jgi:MFS transporter, CP family, cyanate transporter
VQRDKAGLYSATPQEHDNVDAALEERGSTVSPYYLVLTLFLVGINLRPAQSSVAPVLDAIRTGEGLSSTAAGVLTMLPVLCFGIFAPLAPRLLNRFCAERVVFFSLLLLSAALVCRVLFGFQSLFLGTFAAGGSIGVIMVLLPSLIKQDFPRRAAGMMGVYTMAMCLGAALSAGFTVPMKQLAGGSWRSALAFWSIPVLIAAAAWSRRLRHGTKHQGAARYGVGALYTSPLAWQVTAFLGLQSALAYCVFGWLPSMLIDRGMSPLGAGATLSLTIGMQLATALGGPWLCGLRRDQRAVIAITMTVVMISFVGCFYAGIEMIWLWASLLGLGLGGSFSIALTLIILRAENSAVASALSGMAQGFGYSIAALGPLIFGLLRDVSHNWRFAIVFFIWVGVVALIAGLAAGRDRYVTAVVSRVG